jgi:hypothetical protein
MSKPVSSETEEIPSLYEQLQRVPDPRDDQGKRHPLAAMLALARVALLCGYRHLMQSRSGLTTTVGST